MTMKGKAQVRLTSVLILLAEGDYICHLSDQDHIFEALEPDT